MSDKVNFGKFLEMLLCVRGWSAARLAKELNVDSSYTRKWIRGTRVPSLQNGYVKQIADALSSGLTLYNRESIKCAFIETIKSMGLEACENLPLNELLFECLYKTQIYSLGLSSDERENKLNKVQRQLDNLTNLTTDKFNRLNGFSYLPEYKLANEIRNIPLILHGMNNILNTAVSIIKAAIEKNRFEKADILLTFQGENEVFYGSERLDNVFDYEIKNALLEGVDVYHLCRLNKNIDRSFRIIEKIINFLGCKGKYLPYYFNKYGTIKFPMEFIVCEGIGALICFSSSNNGLFDTAFFYSQEEVIDSLKKYLELYFIETSPLVEILSQEDYFKYITEAEARMGNQFSLLSDFGTLTYPYSLWVKFLNRTIEDEDKRNEHLARIYSIFQSFFEQIEHYNFNYIMKKQLVEQIVKTDKYPTYNMYRKYYTEDIIEHFEYIVLLLKKYKNYNIALVNENINPQTNKIEWVVKGDYATFIFINELNNPENISSGNEVIISIKETTIASAFKDYFLELWDRVPPVDKDKENVIEWFENQIRILKKQF